MSENLDICFPQDQQEGTEAIVLKWLKAPGEIVAAHQAVAEIETDKVVVEVTAPASTAGTKANGRIRLSPAARHRLLKYEIDATQITGSGKNGRITVQDVEAFVQQENISLAPATPISKIPHDNMRKRIAQNMVASLMQTAPHVTSVFEADLSAVMRHRAEHKAEFEECGTPLTLTAYFVAASVAALREVPQANSRWHDDYLEMFRDIHIGIGTALGDQGLIVPVLHQAGQKNLKGIAAGLADLTTHARAARLTPADVRGGTFTISNHGVSGSLIATPIIINQPQSAILGVGKIEKRVKVKEVEGQDVLAIRPSCYVSLTIDHRVLNGYQTNTFLAKLVETLENWPG